MNNNADFQVDLTNCDREPIHQLGRVQSYGALVAVSSDWIVQHTSSNVKDIFDIEPNDLLGKPLTELIVSDTFDRIRQNLSILANPSGVVRMFGVIVRGAHRLYDISLHQSGKHMVIEFEPKSGPRDLDVTSEVYPLINRLQHKVDMTDLAREAARCMRRLSGFDSVMVYQFQPDASGRVLAEDRADGERRYLGLNFPASDIPVQARALYKRSLLRLIADVNDEGSLIVPPQTSAGQPLDLSLAVTRSVSPIHIEYLKNMGVEASMSVSIMKNGELWGLFACHNHSPLYIDYERRTAIEMFAHLFSYELSRQEEHARAQVEIDSGRLQTMLIAHMADGRSLADSLLNVSEDIERVIPHDGIILYTDGKFFRAGATPTEEEFYSLARMLDTRIGTAVYATDHLVKMHPDAEDFVQRCAGILAIPISKRPRDYIILCRRPIEQTVQWAGDPNKPVETGPNGVRLTPRKSFDVWKENVAGRSAPWDLGSLHAAELLRTVLLEIFLKMTDAANEERRRAQEHQQLLISELNHRVRNILNLIRGLVSTSKNGANTLTEFTASLDGRIQSLARAHDQLTKEKWEPSSLKSLIRMEFEAYAMDKNVRVKIEGPDVMLAPTAYTTMALVLHEMATNSLKYGALCDQSGRIEIDLSIDRSGGLLIDWKEKNGPPVAPPTRRGFGSTIIERSIPHELRGDAEIHYRVTGVVANFRVPPSYINSIIEVENEVSTTDVASADKSGFNLGGTALVLEDALIIAMDAAAILESAGASKVVIASSVQQALEEIERHQIDFALLDVNLGSEQSVPVAELLYERGTPFVVATGYGETEEIQASYPPCKIVQKPFSSDSLMAAFKAAHNK